MFLLTFVPYAGEGSDGILRNVFLYRSWRLPYGAQLLLPPSVNTAIMAVAVTVAPRLTHRMPMERALLIGLLTWLVFTQGIAGNYFALLIPIACLNAPRDRRWLWPLSVLVAIIELEFTGLLDVSPVVGVVLWAGLWCICAAWLRTLVIPALFLRRQ